MASASIWRVAKLRRAIASSLAFTTISSLASLNAPFHPLTESAPPPPVPSVPSGECALPWAGRRPALCAAAHPRDDARPRPRALQAHRRALGLRRSLPGAQSTCAQQGIPTPSSRIHAPTPVRRPASAPAVVTRPLRREISLPRQLRSSAGGLISELGPLGRVERALPRRCPPVCEGGPGPQVQARDAAGRVGGHVQGEPAQAVPQH